MAYIYSWVTQELFDDALVRILNEKSSTRELLNIAGIYEVLAEHYNNEVLDLLVKERRERR